MALVAVESDSLGNALSDVMLAPDITPGDDVSYQTCKTLFLYHPLGFKMVCAPLTLALSEGREIVVPDSPGERTVKAFKEQWQLIGADDVIMQTMALSRVYGIASLALMIDGKEPNEALDPWSLGEASIAFNVYDPLNTSGSLITNQQPLSMDFLKPKGIAVQGKDFHKSRTVTVMNEFPVYIAWTPAAFGFVGRSVFQRAFFPLKSYLRTMIVDDMIETKVGVLVAKLKQAGVIANAIIKTSAWFKREVVKEAQSTNVINITTDEDIQSLNLMNMDGPHTLARRNILENIATAADMPIKLLAQEAFVEGFGEGTEDAKAIARYIDRMRTTMQPLFGFLDRIVMHRAWTPAFFEGMQKDFVQTYGDKTYKEAFYIWANSFTANWPSMLKEPESELARLEDTKLKAVIALIQVFEPILDSENKLALYQWATDNISANETMFVSPLEFDFEALAAHLDDMEAQEEEVRQQQQSAMQQVGMGGVEEGGGEPGMGPKREVPVKMGRADRATRRADFDRATAIMDKVMPEARDVIPIDKLRKALVR